MPGTQAAIEVRQMRKVYQSAWRNRMVVALDGVDLEVPSHLTDLH